MNMTTVVGMSKSFFKKTARNVSLLMNYSYETFYCCWAESLLLVQICNKIAVHRSIRCIFVFSLADLISNFAES